MKKRVFSILAVIPALCVLASCDGGKDSTTTESAPKTTQTNNVQESTTNTTPIIEQSTVDPNAFDIKDIENNVNKYLSGDFKFIIKTTSYNSNDPNRVSESVITYGQKGDIAWRISEQNNDFIAVKRNGDKVEYYKGNADYIWTFQYEMDYSDLAFYEHKNGLISQLTTPKAYIKDAQMTGTKSICSRVCDIYTITDNEYYIAEGSGLCLGYISSTKAGNVTYTLTMEVLDFDNECSAPYLPERS